MSTTTSPVEGGTARPDAADEDVRPFRAGGWRGVATPWLLEAMGGADPASFVRRHSAALLSDQVYGETHRLHEIEGRRLYGKIMAGVRSRRSHPAVRWLKWVARPSRALQVWRVSSRFQASGLACAPVALAARGGPRLAPIDVLLTEEAAGRNLRQRLIDDPPELALEACRRTGASLAALHRAGILHGDATHTNVVIAAEGEGGSASMRIVWIDNDRTRAWPLLPRALARRNLEQMSFHVRRWGLHPLRALVEGYADALGLSARARRRLRGKLARRLRSRRARFRERGLSLMDARGRRIVLGRSR